MKNRLLATLLLAGTAVAAADLQVPQVRLPLLPVAPVIDGTVDAREWAGAARMEGFGRGPQLAPLAASFWVGCDGKELFVAVVSETPPGCKLLSRIAPLPDAGDARTWLDDSIEFVLDPQPGGATGRRLYHANLNAKGAINDMAYAVGGNAEAWRGHWRTASQVVDDRWYFEVALPLADIGLAALQPGQSIGVRICRNWQQTPVAGQTEWSPRGGPYLTPETIPLVTFDPTAPVVQVLQLSNPEKPGIDIKVSVTDPRAEAPDTSRDTLKVTLSSRPKNSAPASLDKTIVVGPGESTVLELTGAGLDEDVETLIRVTSADGKSIHYLREFQWRPARPANVWALDESAARKIQTQFAYYPSFNKIHFRVDLNNFEDKAKVTGGTVLLRRKGASEALATSQLPALKAAASRLLWDVPPLGEGEYECVLTLAGVKTDPVIQPFVRHVMPWEGNQLGRSAAVIPPFTPIVVDGKAVGTVLRQHALGNLGLWDQVTSLGVPLLAAPMQLQLKVDGAAADLQTATFTVTEAKPHTVTTESRWQGQGVSLKATGLWDYDGLMLWTLDLTPEKGKDPAPAIDALSLEIPFLDTQVPLFHACTDGLRFNYAGATPAGEGRVWDGRKAPRNSIVGSYVPYIWLGAEERGLAVCGENDRGWVTASDVPCQELVRNGNMLRLRLNLIAKRSRLDTPRRIVIGFQATPVKPMPRDWRRIIGSYAMKVPEGGRHITFNGSCWSWGALTPCLDIYPRDCDLSLWDEYAKTRRTGEVNAEFFEKWIAGFPAKTEDDRKLIRGNNNYGFHILKGKPTDVLVYTNARGVRLDTPEGQTFLDEWHRDAFATRTWPPGGGVAYDLNPGASFRDYALFYYQKMYSTFVDHIYWDDIFMQACFDVIGTEAYELPDGQVQPSVGLFDMRQLVRRTAVLSHELGRAATLNQVHMTNTAIAPILAFAGSQLAWEDRVGDTDFQDRYTRDYLRAESIGRQFGNMPFALVLIQCADPGKRAWVERTATGVLLAHEMRCGAVLKDQDKNLQTLYDFGYGTDTTQVYNYWQAALPVTLSRADAIQLTVTKPGAALVLVCDYGNGGTVTVKPDLAKLGIAGNLTASDTESGQPLSVAEGAVTLDLKKHDFRLIRLEGGTPK